MSTSLRDLAPHTRPKVSAWLASLRDAGVQGQITSTRRSRLEQTRLWKRFVSGQSILPAAPPGSSKHELGLAIDIVFPTDEGFATAVDAAEEFGLRWAGPDDPVHFEDQEQPQDAEEVDVSEALLGSAPGAAGQFIERAFEEFTHLGTINSVAGFFGLGDRVCCGRQPLRGLLADSQTSPL